MVNISIYKLLSNGKLPVQSRTIVYRNWTAPHMTPVVDCAIKPQLYQSNSFTFSIEVTTQDSVTPSFTISSALRISSQLGSSTYSATVGDTLYWTIDIPCKYFLYLTIRLAYYILTFSTPGF